MLLLRSVLGVLQLTLLLNCGTFAQRIRNRNVHCDKFYEDKEEEEIPQIYMSRKMYVCEIRNYEFSSDTDYYLQSGFEIRKLIISDSSMEKLPKHLFYSARNLKYLIVKNTTLKHVDQIQDYNRGTMLVLSMIKLTNNKIETLTGSPFHLSLGYSQNYQYIDLSHNKINKIMPTFFDSVKISKLNLSHNSLEELDLNIFNSIVGLDLLDLSYNKMKILNSTELSTSPFFTLYLSYNEFTSLDFRNCSIRFLILRNNRLKSLAIGRNIEELDAENNAIAEMSIELSYSSLRTLNMNGNNLGNNLQNICKCNNLITLYLNSNNIDDIGYCFGEMASLKTLRLARNNIYQINHYSFHEENKIELLDLSHNRIEVIDEYTMAIFDNLKYLYLNGNPIHDFNDSPKNFMPNLLEVGLSHNKFKCSRLFVVLKKLKNQNIKLYVDKTLMVNTTNIDGNACYENHVGELMKDPDLDDVQEQKTNEKFSFFWEKINNIDAKINVLSSTLNKTVEELVKLKADQVKERDLFERLNKRLEYLEEIFRNTTEEKLKKHKNMN